MNVIPETCSHTKSGIYIFIKKRKILTCKFAYVI